MDKSEFEALADGQLAPFGVLLLRLALLAAILFGNVDKAFGGVRAAVEDDVLDAGAQLRVDIVIDVELAVSRRAGMAWYRKTECMARRTASLPRKLNETLESPPETWQPGRFSRIRFVASMKSTP